MKQDELLERVSRLACDAGQAILEVYESSDFDVELKDDQSPLTRADKRSHDVLAAGLENLDLGPVLSEEGAKLPWSERRAWEQYWLIDPLDGTKEFIKRNGEFTVNVALVRNGRPVLGVVYAPVKHWLYFGATGQGAFKRVGTTSAAEPIQVAAVPAQDQRWKIVGSRSHQSEEFAAFVSRFPSADIVSMGSSLKLCLVAEGHADLYPRLGLTSEWDTAAAQAIVEAAGGQVLNWETQQPLLYNTKDSLLNPFFIVCAAPSRVWMN